MSKINKKVKIEMTKKKKENSPNSNTFMLGDHVMQAITCPGKRDPKTGINIPSEENVKEAKDWVDTNGLS